MIDFNRYVQRKWLHSAEKYVDRNALTFDGIFGGFEYERNDVILPTRLFYALLHGEGSIDRWGAIICLQYENGKTTYWLWDDEFLLSEFRRIRDCGYDRYKLKRLVYNLYQTDWFHFWGDLNKQLIFQICEAVDVEFPDMPENDDLKFLVCLLYYGMVSDDHKYDKYHYKVYGEKLAEQIAKYKCLGAMIKTSAVIKAITTDDDIKGIARYSVNKEAWFLRQVYAKDGLFREWKDYKQYEESRKVSDCYRAIIVV